MNNRKIPRKAVSKGNNPSVMAFRLQSKVYFLTYKGIFDSGEKIDKNQLANYLLKQNKNDLKLRPEKYLICQQMYDSGEPHFHVILIYPKRKDVTTQDYYDYLGVHPNIQTMRNMKAALQYVHKEDPNPVTNMNITQQKRVARAQYNSSLYQLLRQQMLKDPINFNVYDYCHKHDIDKQIYKTNYNKAITLLNNIQPAAARALYASKPGIKLITPMLIEQQFDTDQIMQFYSHPCYQKIIDHINQIHKYPNTNPTNQAPLKTKHLLIVGGPDIGKTSLIYHRSNGVDPYPGLAHYYATYYFSVGQKYFPPYRSYDYRLVNWQQFTIASDMFPKKGYNRLLNYLDGSVSALPQKGRPPAQRQDNPKHILTSNRTLQQHIFKTFNSEQSRAMSRRNLCTRIDCVRIPQGKNIHFLRKLFVSN